IQQRLPWLAKLELKERAALFAARAAHAEVEAVRLDLLTETRRLLHELAFLDAHEQILVAERTTLDSFETAAQARYAAGTGLQQESVRIQAQITRVDTLLLEIAERRATLLAALNALRDLPADTPVASPVPTGPRSDTIGPGSPTVDATVVDATALDGAALEEQAFRLRPEVAAAEARIAAAEALVELAEKQARPDLTLGLSYTLVQGRRDLQGRLSPPEDDGDDILALSASLNLPVWRRKIEAGIEEARASLRAAEQEERQLRSEIRSSIGDLTSRIPLLRQQLRLLENVLLRQAREALRSAETAYRSGKLDAVDLLDAEVVLFEVRIAAERTRADLAVARARLERAVGHAVEKTLPEVAQ
ncbi:MAG: TolC family protein, partial [Holophagales bacterium]|nr:TolC family protein [Holophagales bacterium]